MPQARKILLADPDLDAVRGLSRALRERKYQVSYAPDGSRALEVAVLRHPDLILFDEGCKLLEARSFINILRTNPRTEDIPVVLTLTQYTDRVQGLRDGYLRKPFNLDEVLSRIDHLFRRSDAARQLRGETKEIEGALGNLSLPDILQILSMNRRTGRLAVERGQERGEIHVADGRPVNAKVAAIEGEKALFRLLTWKEGAFAFMPLGVAPRERIQRAMDDALLEGLRQADELARLAPRLPPSHARVEFSPEAELSAAPQHPVTAQVVAALRQPRTVPELLDLAPAVDLDVVAALLTLLDKGVARLATGSDEGLELLGAAEIHALRTRLFRGRAAPRSAVTKVLVCGKLPAAGRRVSRELPQVSPTPSEGAALRSGLGTLGRLTVSEALAVDFCLLPASDAARPLWRPFSAGSLGALLLDDSEGAFALARYLAWEVRVPVVVSGAEVPAALRGAPAGVYAVPGSLMDALRGLLIAALRPLSDEGGERARTGSE